MSAHPDGCGIDWKTSLVPNYTLELESIKAGLQAYARRPPDDFTIYIASHMVLCLRRVATGRHGLKILGDWNSIFFNGYTTAEMIQRSCAWLSATAADRAAALDAIDEHAAIVRAELQSHDDAQSYLDELALEVADAREQRAEPPHDALGALPQTSAVKELRRALHAYSRAYILPRSTAMNDPAEIVAALPARRIK